MLPRKLDAFTGCYCVPLVKIDAHFAVAQEVWTIQFYLAFRVPNMANEPLCLTRHSLGMFPDQLFPRGLTDEVITFWRQLLEELIQVSHFYIRLFRLIHTSPEILGLTLKLD